MCPCLGVMKQDCKELNLSQKLEFEPLQGLLRTELITSQWAFYDL